MPCSETEKNILEDLFSSELSTFKKYHLSGNLKFDNLSIFQSLKLRDWMGKILRISLKLNFTPNNLGCYGLTSGFSILTFSYKTKFIHRGWPADVLRSIFPWPQLSTSLWSGPFKSIRRSIFRKEKRDRIQRWYPQDFVQNSRKNKRSAIQVASW